MWTVRLNPWSGPSDVEAVQHRSARLEICPMTREAQHRDPTGREAGGQCLVGFVAALPVRKEEVRAGTPGAWPMTITTFASWSAPRTTSRIESADAL